MTDAFLTAEDREHPEDPLKVVVAGVDYSGWQQVSISRTIDQAAGSFKITAVPTRSEAWPIKPLQEVSIQIGGLPMVSGFVDSLRASSNSDGRQLELTGRDKAADLVDSSAVVSPGEWRNLRLEELARELADPFGVDIIRGDFTQQDVPSDLEPFPLFAVNPGETAWTAIERAARMRGVLVFSDGSGNLVIEPAGPRLVIGYPAVKLVEGGEDGNIVDSTVRWSLADRFRVYIVRGQGQGSDVGWGRTVAEVEGLAQDLEIDRDRQLIVIAEGQVSTANAQDRAQWEAAVRRARSLVLEIKVMGWFRSQIGPPWSINRNIEVSIASLGIAGRFLIRGLRFTRSVTEAAMTTISLVPKGALNPQPIIPAGKEPFEGLLDADNFEEDF